MKDDDESTDRLKFEKASVIESKGKDFFYPVFASTKPSYNLLQTQRE